MSEDFTVFSDREMRFIRDHVVGDLIERWADYEDDEFNDEVLAKKYDMTVEYFQSTKSKLMQENVDWIIKWIDKLFGKMYYLPKEYRTHLPPEKSEMKDKPTSTVDPLYEKKEKEGLK